MSRWPGLLLLSLLVLGCTARPPDPGPPNIVLIISDDQGYPDFGFMGSPHVQTPNLDRLAESGTVFTHAYNTASICRPSLRSLLTGLHPVQWDLHVRSMLLDGKRRAESRWIRDFVTLPRLLGEQGYASFQAGKFWEADYADAGFSDGLQEKGEEALHGGASRFIGRERLTPITQFIDRHRDGPFLIWFAPMLPHTPHDAPESDRALYLDQGLARSAVAYYANITRLDTVVGELLAQLEEQGLRERTLVVFLADNGWDQSANSERHAWIDGPHGKKTFYELGLRTPLIFSWPGVVPAGRRLDALVSTVDLLPTLLDYAEAPARPELPGFSLRPTLQEGQAWPRRRVVGFTRQARAVGKAAKVEAASREGTFFVRTARWWYIWYRDRGIEELYDARDDPRAQHDLAGTQPGVVEELRGEAQRWLQQMRSSVEPHPSEKPAAS